MFKKNNTMTLIRQLICAGLACALLLSSTATALAQEKARSGFVTGRFGDNWFIEFGGGVNSVLDNGSFGKPRAAAELRFGKWFLPHVGLALGVHGVQNVANNIKSGWFCADRTFWFGHLDADVLWNMSNTIGGYRPDRTWNFIPYARFSYIYASEKMNSERTGEFGAGGGLRNAIRLADRVDLYLDLGAVVSREKAFRESGSVICFPSADLGLTVRVGRQGFRRKTKEVVEVEKIVTVTKEVKDTVVIKEEVKDSVLIEKLRSTPLTLYFEIDKTFLTERELAHLEFYVNNVVTPEMKLILVGSADKETGNKKHNQELSEGRAEYVRNILLETYHLNPENVRTVAEGDWNNIYNTPEKNRVVTIYIEKEEIHN